MNTFEIVKLAISGAVALAVIVSFVLRLIRSNALDKITATLESAVVEAERTGLPGAEKKAYVIAEVEKKCGELGLPFGLLKAAVSGLIDEIVGHYNLIAK